MSRLQNNPNRLRWKRRIRNGSITLCVVGLLIWWVSRLEQSLQDSSFHTGYLLFASFLLLTAFGMRKRLAFLPNVGTANFWMQLHLYVGLATFAMFGLHIQWRIPDGWLECTLAGLFLVVGVSGIYGIVITRVYPVRLTSLGGEVIFERIPRLRAQIASRARNLVLDACEGSDVLGRFYVNQLAGFLERPRGIAYMVVPNGRLKRQLIADIEDLDRYLSEPQRAASRELSEMVEQRDRLDYHQALQGRLKLWLFVHIGFTYSLLLLSVLHLVLAHAFAGGAG